MSYYGLNFEMICPGVGHRLGWLASRGERLAVQAWLQPAGSGAQSTLVLVHGLFDHVGIFGHLVAFGLLRGSNVVAFDLPGHGLSSGERAAIDDFADYSGALNAVLAAIESLPGERHLLGQSTGGAAIMDYLTTTCEHQPARVVLLAPLVRPRDWGLVRLGHSLLHRFTATLKRGFADNSNDADFLAFLRAEPLQPRVISMRWIGALKRWLADFERRPASPQPLLVVQGDEDGTVQWEYNVPYIRRQFPNSQVYMLQGGRHHLANESDPLRTEYLAVVSHYLDTGHLP